MTARRPRKPRPPLDPEALNELALAYAARFATTRAKLAQYLQRKLRERGWAEGPPADVAGLVERFERAGLVDDSAFAMAKSLGLTRRGYGQRRVATALRSAGVDEDHGAPALAAAAGSAAAAALRFAERKRLGPFAAESPADRRERDRQLAAMIRAGHPFDLALAILRCPPGQIPDESELPGANSHTGE